MPRNFSEPWEPEDIFDQQEAAERRRRMDAIAEHNAILAAQEAAADAARQAENVARVKAAHARTIIGQYQAAGVEPLAVDANGVPLLSLSMLISMGWSIVAIEGENYLVKPQHIKPPESRKRKADYDQGN